MVGTEQSGNPQRTGCRLSQKAREQVLAEQNKKLKGQQLDQNNITKEQKLT